MYALAVLAFVVAVPLAVVAWRAASFLPLHIRGMSDLTLDEALVELLRHATSDLFALPGGVGPKVNAEPG
jgi:hypothetical protein